MNIKTFFDTRTYTLTYLVWDPSTKDAVVIDPVLDFDPETNRVWTESADKVSQVIKDEDLKLHLILETHAHADHLSGSQILRKNHPGSKIVIGDKIALVQETFKPVFGLGDWFKTDGSQFDVLISPDETLEAGSVEIGVIPTPGHTPACVTYKIEDAVFTGDALFMPDSGTGRCDFPKGSAKDLYDSVHNNLYNLPDDTRVFVGHDYQPNGREVAYETTIGEEKKANIQLTENTSEDQFIGFRKERDAGLKAPRLLYQSVQVNIDAGKLPPGSTDDTAKLVDPTAQKAAS
jgi:glyoxylase-like metal-dependent hydrolase (beta-lactamase superfamily II)